MDAENLKLIEDIMPDALKLWAISPFPDERILLYALRALEVSGKVDSEETGDFVIYRKVA